MAPIPACHQHYRTHGFTLVELVVVLICLAISLLIVSPTLSNRNAMELAKAAEMLAGDLEFAQAQSMTHADDPRVVVFDASTNSYLIAASSNPVLPLTHPADQDAYRIQYGFGRAAFLSGVTIGTLQLDGDSILKFKELGDIDQVAPAAIELRCGKLKVTVTVDPISGRCSVSEVH
jgi:prepilin-type N-terminal cleavage/methylation domain-containing protein